MSRLGIGSIFCCAAFAASAFAQVPNEIQQPGTQPMEVNLESVTRCDNCHGGYNVQYEPAHNWRAGMMAYAPRDPLMWATLAVAEQDFPGSGDLCLRCHSPQGWLGGRSEPTNGSALTAADSFGVECDVCHQMVNPSGLEHSGVQNAPYIANDGGAPPHAYLGGAMYVMTDGNAKLGPYADTPAKHQFAQSLFHRSSALCGTCHDVSNPAVGDLAPNAGVQPTADPVVRDGTLGGPLTSKAAFNNLPFQYGIVERTFSEHMSSALPNYAVSDYPQLPAELQFGALAAAYDAALLAGTGGNYEDGTVRTFSCQTCHIQPTVGYGSNKAGTPLRHDLPHHAMVGGNYWMPDAMVWLANQGRLPVGNTFTGDELAALVEGQARARTQLDRAARLVVTGDSVRVINLTGHKLISGYPEGRRMWLNVRWYDRNNALVREDGAYGPLNVTLNGQPLIVNSLLDLEDEHLRIYAARHGLSQDWAAALIALGYPSTLPLEYDRVDGDVEQTLGELAAAAPGTVAESFHFVINNVIVGDNRIPPYGMQYDVARQRNVLPTPPTQFGDPGPGGVYDCFDDVALDPPATALSAEIRLMYQPTSWEYVQFLYLANAGGDPFLATAGQDLLDAWVQTGMAAPYVMTTATWTGSGDPLEPQRRPSPTDSATAEGIARNGR